MAQETQWNYKKSREFYCIDGWANGYFCINKEGQITVRHCRYLKDKAVPLVDIIDFAKKEHQLQTPLLLRFTNIVKNRVERITKAFNNVRKKIDYAAEYTLIYPIKVNQNCAVVINFNWINQGIFGSIIYFFTHIVKSLGDTFNTILDNIRKS